MALMYALCTATSATPSLFLRVAKQMLQYVSAHMENGPQAIVWLVIINWRGDPARILTIGDIGAYYLVDGQRIAVVVYRKLQ